MEKLSSELNNKIGNLQTFPEDLVPQTTKNKSIITTIAITVAITIFVALSYFGFTFFQKDQNLNFPIVVDDQKENNLDYLEPIQTSNLDTVLENTEKKYLKNWSIHTSEKLGISFENPGIFFLETTYENLYPNESHITLFELKDFDKITEPSSLGSGGSNNFIAISAYENSENLDLIEWAKMNSGQSNYQGNHKSIILDGNNAIRFVWEGMGLSETVLTKNKNGQIISISYTKNENLEDYFELLLKSVKFN